MVDHPATPTDSAVRSKTDSRCRKAGSTGSWCCPFVMRSTCSAAQLTGAIRDALGKAPAGLIVDLSVLLTSVSLADFELDSLILVKRAKTARISEWCTNTSSAPAIRSDKAEALIAVKTFYSSLCRTIYFSLYDGCNSMHP